MFARCVGPARNATAHISQRRLPNVGIGYLSKRWNTSSTSSEGTVAPKPPRVVFSGIQPTGIPHVSSNPIGLQFDELYLMNVAREFPWCIT